MTINYTVYAPKTEGDKTQEAGEQTFNNSYNIEVDDDESTLTLAEASNALKKIENLKNEFGKMWKGINSVEIHGTKISETRLKEIVAKKWGCEKESLMSDDEKTKLGEMWACSADSSGGTQTVKSSRNEN